MTVDQLSEASRLAHRSELLAYFGAEALRAMPLLRLLEIAVDATRRGVDTNNVKVLQPDPDGSLRVVAGVGWRPGVVGHARLSATMASPPGRAFLTGTPTIIEDVRAEPSFELSDLLREHNIVSLVNVPIKSGNSTFGVLEVDATAPTRWSDGDINFLLGFANLVTVAIQRNRLEAQRNLLTREVHHRVKNNLQLITSMMRISARRTQSDEARQILDDLSRRVTVVASVYQMLIASGTMDRVSLRDYLGDLCGKLAMTTDRVRISTAITDRVIEIDEAISLGLIANEVVTNSLKHAFPDRTGAVTVSVRPTAEPDWMTLSISDDGVGMQEAQKTGFGLQIIHLLAGQLGGTTSFSRASQGTVFEARLRLRAVEK